jgi:hypothetical protein
MAVPPGPVSGEGNFRLYCSDEELYALHLGQGQVWPPKCPYSGEGNFRLYCSDEELYAL